MTRRCRPYCSRRFSFAPKTREGHNFRALPKLLTPNIGRIDDAIATLEKYQQRDPLNKRIGEAVLKLHELKQQSQQLQQLEQSVAAAPTNMTLSLQLAQVYNQLGRPDKAAPLQERALAAQPQNAQLIMQLAGRTVSFTRQT